MELSIIKIFPLLKSCFSASLSAKNSFLTAFHSSLLCLATTIFTPPRRKLLTSPERWWKAFHRKIWVLLMWATRQWWLILLLRLWILWLFAITLLLVTSTRKCQSDEAVSIRPYNKTTNNHQTIWSFSSCQHGRDKF